MSELAAIAKEAPIGGGSSLIRTPDIETCPASSLEANLQGKFAKSSARQSTVLIKEENLVGAQAIKPWIP